MFRGYEPEVGLSKMTMLQTKLKPARMRDRWFAPNCIMKFDIQGETLCISGLRELGATNSNDFRDRARAALTPAQRNIEIDLSETMFLDSYGLGSLISLHKMTISRNGKVRLLNPTAGVQQILELTRMHRLFEISTAGQVG
jgi:anti-sigma B factor antagonist